jgi:tRNA pseudouridine55 synthase
MAAESMASGVLLVDKPTDWTSHDVIARLRRHLGTRTVGHAGTLDPFATGLLVVLIGNATRLSQWLVGHRKRYVVRARFGLLTDTGDRTGTIIKEEPADVTRQAAESAAAAFPRKYAQVPPAFSAKKIAGKAAYDLARAGKNVELKPCDVEISELNITAVSGADLDFVADVSAGTYIRSLVVDFAASMGQIATTQELRRVRCGAFDLRDAATMDAILALPKAAVLQRLVPMADALADGAVLAVSAEEARAFVDGRSVSVAVERIAGAVSPTINTIEPIAVTMNGELLGVARGESDGGGSVVLKVLRVMQRWLATE